LTLITKIDNNTMEIKRALIPFEIKADGDVNSDSGVFEGYGSTFGNIDFGADIVRQGAFAKSLDEWKSKNQLPQMLYYHESHNAIGDWIEMREDEKGLFVKGTLWVKGDRRIDDAVRSYNILRGTGPKGLSIGYVVKESRDVETVNGIVRELIEIELMEVSIAPFAMNDQAFVTNVKSLVDIEGKVLSKRDVEKVLRDAGLSKRQSKAFIASGYEAIARDANGDDEAKNRDDSDRLAGVLEKLSNLSNRIS